MILRNWRRKQADAAMAESRKAFSRIARNKRSRRGAAVVEFAIIAPLFFLLVLGIIEFSRMLMVKEVLINAARGGAREAILAGATDTNVQTTITSYMSAAGISGFSWSVSPDESTSPGSGTAMTITVTEPCATVSWTGFMNWFSGQSLSASVVMIHE